MSDIDSLMATLKEIKQSQDALMIKQDHLSGRLSETNAGIANFKTEFIIRMNTIDKRGCEKGEENFVTVKETIDNHAFDFRRKIAEQTDRINSQRNIFAGAGIAGTIIATVLSWWHGK